MNPRERDVIHHISSEVREQEKPRERLSDEELDNLLAAIGNHEAKAVTLLVMETNTIYASRDLHQAVLNAQGNSIGWKLNQMTSFRYCEDSLSPIGLVTKEVIDELGNTFGYAKTEYGKQVGVPLAGLLLDFSRRHPDISLYQLFGSTHSPQIRELLESSYERNLTVNRVRTLTQSLNDEGKIIQTKKGKVIKWRIATAS